MKLSWLRSPQGKREGIAWFFGSGTLIRVEKPFWKRSCELCFSPAILWCESHATYLCSDCLQVHAGQVKHYKVGNCAFVAVTNKLNPERAASIHQVSPERLADKNAKLLR